MRLVGSKLDHESNEHRMFYQYMRLFWGSLQEKLKLQTATEVRSLTSIFDHTGVSFETRLFYRIEKIFVFVSDLTPNTRRTS